jgi:putative SOS response-associated peptidase YedK
MCGKFTAKVSWTEVINYIWTSPRPDDVPAPASEDDPTRIYRVMDLLQVIVLDGDQRRVHPMRWGFPDPRDARRPQPIHARAEGIDTTRAFADAFKSGQRGIVIAQTFNEAPDIAGPTVQHTISPSAPVGIAVVWKRFQIAALSEPLFACCMVTVAANRLIAGLPTDRMPAILAPEDWATWLGEGDATPEDAKACLKTVDDVRWTMTREQRAKTAKRAKPTVSDPPGLF